MCDKERFDCSILLELVFFFFPQFIKTMGNARAKEIYEANCPPNYPRPRESDTGQYVVVHSPFFTSELITIQVLSKIGLKPNTREKNSWPQMETPPPPE